MLPQEGIDLATRAKILGHKSIRIVERYVHPTDERKKNASSGTRRVRREPRLGNCRGKIETEIFAVLLAYA